MGRYSETIDLTKLRHVWHMKGVEGFLQETHAAFPPVIGSMFTLHLPDGPRSYWVIAECPVRGIEDGREHHLVTLSPKAFTANASTPNA